MHAQGLFRENLTFCRCAAINGASVPICLLESLLTHYVWGCNRLRCVLPLLCSLWMLNCVLQKKIQQVVKCNKWLGFCLKILRTIEMFRELCTVYVTAVISEAGMRQWCIRFKNSRTNVHEEVWFSRSSILNDELVQKQINEKIRENRNFRISELSLKVTLISWSLLFGIMT